MQKDEIIVTHEGKQWLVQDGRLVSFREVEVDMGRTPEEFNAKMAAGIPLLRESISRYIADNDPYFP